jgi:3,4-dihydroxybenzoyl-citryl-spermidine/N-citryl-spermidine--spermidine ligase
LPEARVLRQLVEALLFERVATWESQPQSPHAPGDEELSFSVGASSYRCRGRVGAFGRVRVAAGSVRKVLRHVAREATWQEVLSDVPAAASMKAAVADELESTVRLSRWNQLHLPALRQSRRGLPYEDLEGLLHEGHPYHPCFKARTGFSLADQAAYGPEAGRSFELCWIAVQRSKLAQTLGTQEADHWLAQLGAEGASLLDGARRKVGAEVESYGVLPVHPWQWRRLLGAPALEAALARRELIDLRLATGRYRASQSLRTLLPSADSRASQVKLPLDLRVTSSARTLRAETVKAAPALSAWLSSLVAADPFFEQVTAAVVLAEHASSVYEPRDADVAALDGNLAAIWREPVVPRLRGGEQALPFNALFATEHDGKPHIDPWLDRYGVAAWVQQLLRVTLLPLWRLLAHHGVALEAHAQNLLLLHEDGWPTRLALRDFHESLEYVPHFLAEPGRVPRWGALDRRFAAAAFGSHYAMESVVELRELFVDSVLVFNLCELSFLLEQRRRLSEQEFWRSARGVLAQYSRSPWSDVAREAQLRLSEPVVRAESLFKARLRANGDALLQHLVPSALHDHS